MFTEWFEWFRIDAEAFGWKSGFFAVWEICGWNCDSMDDHFGMKPLRADVFLFYSGVREVSKCGGGPEGKK